MTFALLGWETPSENERFSKLLEFADNGAEHIALTNDVLMLMAGNYPVLARIREQMAAAKLDFVDAHAPFRFNGDLFTPDEQEHRIIVARHKFLLSLIGELGVKTCTFHVGSRYRKGYSMEAHRDMALRSLEELLPAAERVGVTICLENLRGPLNTADDLLFFMKKFDSPYLGVCFDSGHANLKESDGSDRSNSTYDIWALAGLEPQWEERIAERLQPYIVTCHIHDNYGLNDDHYLPGNGTVDWSRIVPIILGAPRLKCIQSEVEARTSVRKLVEKTYALFGATARRPANADDA